jgi:hypothetical protein
MGLAVCSREKDEGIVDRACHGKAKNNAVRQGHFEECVGEPFRGPLTRPVSGDPTALQSGQVAKPFTYSRSFSALDLSGAHPRLAYFQHRGISMKDQQLWAFIDEAYRNLAHAQQLWEERPSDFSRRHVQKARSRCEHYVEQWHRLFGTAPPHCSPIAATPQYQQPRRDRKKVEMLFALLKRILQLDRLRLRGTRTGVMQKKTYRPVQFEITR